MQATDAEEQAKFLRHDQLLKVVVLGDAKAGKSSLVRRFAEDTFSEEYVETLAVAFKTKIIELNEKRIKLQIW